MTWEPTAGGPQADEATRHLPQPRPGPRGLLTGDHRRLGELMDENFDLRLAV